MHNPKFTNKDGTITRYSFTCGYVEQYENNDDNRLTLSRESGSAPYHVKGFIEAKHTWECFETVKEARMFIRLHKLQRKTK